MSEPQDLDQLFRSISERHAQDAADTRQAYMDLVALLAPPRRRPAPKGAKHAAVKETNGPAPAPEHVVAVLKAVDKTPEALRRDVRAYVDVREKADRVAAIPHHREERRRLLAQLDELEREFKRVENEWKAKLKALKDEGDRAASAESRGHDARRDLRRDQHVFEVYRVIHGEPAFKKAEEARRRDVERRSDALEYLEQVFFPPPENRESRHTRYEVNECWIGPRPGGRR